MLKTVLLKKPEAAMSPFLTDRRQHTYVKSADKNVLRPRTRNLYDAINPHIFSKVFGLNPIASSPEDANIFGIGSIRAKGSYTIKKSSFLRNVWRNKRKYLSSRSKPLTFSAVDSFVMRECIHPYRNYNILALRGKLSQGVVSAVLQESLDRVVLGDQDYL